MRQSIIGKVCLAMLAVSALAACEAHYVDRDGVTYYDANDNSTDGMRTMPYTKGGLYINNPDEATNTRDNRGSRPQGYGHDVNDDYPAGTTTVTSVYPAGTVIYGDGTIVYPDGTIVQPGTTVYRSGTRTTTTTTVVTPVAPPPSKTVVITSP